jgi:hypothetical protein
MTRYYSLYIYLNFVFFPKDHGNRFFSKHFFHEYKLEHPWFLRRFSFFFYFLKVLQFFRCTGVCGTREPKVHFTHLIIYFDTKSPLCNCTFQPEHPVRNEDGCVDL